MTGRQTNNPHLPVAVPQGTTALAVLPEKTALEVSRTPQGHPVVAWHKDPGLPWQAQAGVLGGVVVGWGVGFWALWEMLGGFEWHRLLLVLVTLGWVAGGSPLLARLIRLLRTRGRVRAVLGPGTLVLEGRRPLRAENDVLDPAAAATARAEDLGDGWARVVVRAPSGLELVVAPQLRPEDAAWLVGQLHAWARGL